MKTIHAVYEEGVFRPLEKVELPERTKVEFVPKIVEPPHQNYGSMTGIIEVMSQEFETGRHDLAAHHNEHQP